MPGFAYGPWIPDVDDLNSTTAPVVYGCLPTSRGWGPWPSLSAISAAVGGVVRGAFMARTSSRLRSGLLRHGDGPLQAQRLDLDRCVPAGGRGL